MPVLWARLKSPERLPLPFLHLSQGGPPPIHRSLAGALL